MIDLGPLKLAAIDAAMKERGWVVSGNGYRHYEPGGTGEATMQRNGDSGECQVISFEYWEPRPARGRARKHESSAELAKYSDELNDEFASIRRSINAIFAPWESVPVASDFEKLKTDCSLLVAYMMGAVTESASTFTGSGELGSKIALLNSGLTYFWGGAFEDFKQRYILDTGTRAVRLTALSEVLGQAVAAETEVWAKVEDDLCSIADKYTEVFKKVAAGNSGSANLTFGVVGAALAGVGLFATGLGATVVASAGIALSLAETIVGATASPDNNQSFGDVASGLSALREALDALSDRVHDEESSITAGIEKIDISVRDHSDLFQLSPAPLHQVEQGEMGVELPAKSVATHTLPAVAEGILDNVNKPKLIASDLRSTLDRNYNAGRSTTGSAVAVEEIAYLLGTLLNELAFDVDNGAKLLTASLDDWNSNEEMARRRIEGLASEIGQTHNGRPADDLFDKPGTHNEGYRQLNMWEIMGTEDPNKNKGPVLK